MAGAQERHTELLADAAMLGEEYRLGSLRWARTASEKIRAKEIVTLCLLALTVCGIPIAFAEGGLIAGLATIAGGACLIAVAEVIDKRLPPPRVERAFWYSGGLVQVVEGEPEPRVVRWEQLVSVSIKTRKDYEDGRVLVAACTVSDQAGVSATLDRHYGPQVPADLAEKASGILAPRLMPRYRAAFDAVASALARSGSTTRALPTRAAPTRPRRCWFTGRTCGGSTSKGVAPPS